MDDILLERLSTFASNIQTLTKDAKALCTCRPWDNDKLEQSSVTASKLQSIINRFNTDLYQYFNTCTSPNADEVSSLTTFQLEGEETLAELNTWIQTDKESKSSGLKSTSNRSKLPELNLQRFRGDALNWYPFWDQFNSNIGQRNLRDVDKLLYLKASLEGEAKNMIDGLETTNENYKIAVDTLKERFGRREQIVDVHYSTLYRIKQAVRPEDCRRTLDEIERHLRVLQSLGEDTNHNHLRFLIMEKFPEDIIYEMKLKLDSESIEEMRKQLNIIISAREDARGFNVKNKAEELRYTTETLHTRESRTNIKPKFNKPKFKTNFNKNEKSFQNNRPSTSAFTGTFAPRKRQCEQKGYDTKNVNIQKRRRLHCAFCDGDHFNDKCTVFKTLAERKGKLDSRCYRCLQEGHRARTCQRYTFCEHCKIKGHHNRALCPKMFSSEMRNKPVNTLHVHGGGSTFLQTAIVEVFGKKGKSRRCRILMDSGSQRSYVTQKVAKDLDLEVVEENHLLVFTFGAKKPREIDSHLVQLKVQTRSEKTRSLYANVVPSITQGISCPRQEIIECSHDKKVVLADDGSLSDRVDILIGNDYYYTFMSTNKIQLGENLYIIDSEFGWILSGKMEDTNDDEELKVLTYFQSSYVNKQDDPDLPLDTGNVKDLWELESIGITDSPNINRDEEAIKHFNETTTIEDNRYFVSWPWNGYPPDLSTNLGLAYGRLVSLLKRLDKESLYVYDQTLKYQLDKGIIEPVPNTDKVDHPVHYLAFHGISSPGKALRLVYDASARVKDSKSLNESLYCGPIMLEDLTGLLIRFRCHNIGITADVEKAFLQMGLHTKDRDVTRFLWMKDITKPATEENLIHYRFTRVPFGIISSPFLLNATIKHHLSNSNCEHVRKLTNDIYVDNLLTGVSNIQEAMDLYTDTKQEFQKISMNIREWSSNSKELMLHIPDTCKDEVVKTLGLNWDVNKDTLQLRVKNVNYAYTKRGVLKSIATIYDPCGFAAPVVLPAKLLLQSLWKEKLQWDAPLPEEVAVKWKDILKDLELVKDICLPRNISKYKDCQLHCFTDSSTKAYAAVVYLLQENNVKFIIGKSRLAPIKDLDNLKIPRLELLGFLIGSRLIQYVSKNVQINVTQQVLWSDSQIVISWYHSSKLLVPFVARRIEEIRRNKALMVRYVPSELNPADVATRPIKTREELGRWLNGPTFLLHRTSTWPCGSVSGTCLLSGEGLTNGSTLETELCTEEELQDSSNEEEIPTFEKDLDKTQEIHVQDNDPLKSVDTDMRIISELQEIINLQRKFFPEEIKGRKTHLVRNLGLFTDVDGIMRCEGRLAHSDLSYDAKHPILLPKDCDFTNKIIKKIHEENYHVGVPHTLSIVRQRFWIPQGRAQVQRVVNKCPECVKHGGGPYALPSTPALPPERVRYESCFAYVGVDYFGPMLVRTDKGQEKRWICLFTCLVIRAIHLEVVTDMTTEECSLAFRRFIATRGAPALIVSDNALQFKLLSEVVTGEGLSERGIKWKFIPQLAPWHGGAYERMVAVVKHCLKRTLQKHLLGDSQLLTIIKEVESVVNTRPLTYVGTDLEHILKPADFLTPGKCINLQNFMDNITSSSTSTKQQLVDGWKRGETIMKEYKHMFINQYLTSLRERYSHSPKQTRVKSHAIPRIGDVVQIKGDSKNRGNWKVGRISELLHGADGLCRVAKVKVGDTVFTRSIAHLYPLEVDELQPLDIFSGERLPVEQPPYVLELDSGRNGDLSAPVGEVLTKSQDDNMDVIEESNVTDDKIVTDNLDETCMSDTRNDSTEMVNKEANVMLDDIEMTEEESIPTQTIEEGHKRAAAVRAMEKIKEWTRHLMTTLTILH